MRLFDLFRMPDINAGVEEFRNEKNAVLLDVRTRDEYRNGHIEKSQLIPLKDIERANTLIKDKNTKIYVYCQSGARARNAAMYLESSGFKNVKNIGGIASYKGRIVR